jgi:hypothetical protein
MDVANAMNHIALIATLALATIQLNWTHSTNQLSDDLQFIVVTNGDLSVPVSQWPTAVIVSATNSLALTGTNAQGGDWVYATPFSMAPGPLFFSIRSSNLWTVSSNSNVASTPPITGPPVNLSIHK